MELIGNGWDELLQSEYEKPYFADLMQSVKREYEEKTVYPPQEKIFSAMSLLPPEKVKVVILGQDPYHGDGQANGIAFAVAKGISYPPSLQNIFKEVENETGKKPNGSTLTGWTRQGVLLLNTTLTVRAHEPTSHSQLGWQRFTDGVISAVSQIKKPLVFMLWGSSAQSKTELIDKRHYILKSVHPSPLSAYRGFFGCGHFVKANEFLKKNGDDIIDWSYADEPSVEEFADYYKNAHLIRRG